MLNVSVDRRIFLCLQPTDMRCSFDGLAARVRHQLLADPADGSWYVFINRRRTQLKLLAFEPSGYCVWSKRLEQGQFASMQSRNDASKALCATELLALLEGFEVACDRRRKRYAGRPESAVVAAAMR
ncbi:IS66 family insertion sequence element accessory protein TnpB [Pseudomonas aeruginosa]|nr:IS66 family insertion sequence element accessory protein TnpB [Pseudomonas aeruginosa]